MTSGAITSESAHKVLVGTQDGVTTRIHSPDAASSSARTNSTIARPLPFRCSYSQRQWMRVGQAIGVLIPMAFAVAIVTPIHLVAVGGIDQLELPALTAKFTIMTSVGIWMTLAVITTALLAPFLSPTFGYHIRNTKLPCAVMPDSMHRLFIEMRVVLLTFVLCQIASAAVGYYLLSNAAPMEVFSRWHPVLLGSSMFLTLGVFVLCFGHVAFMQTRGRKVRDWLRNCWRGVALRSFIPAWDNPRRPIFQSCRASRRLAAAYRSIKIGAAACFAAGGCLAAMSIGDSMLGMGILAVSMIATLTVWPTANGIVNWTKTVVDPITGHANED